MNTHIIINTTTVILTVIVIVIVVVTLVVIVYLSLCNYHCFSKHNYTYHNDYYMF